MVIPNMVYTLCGLVIGAACVVAAYYFNQPLAIENRRDGRDRSPRQDRPHNPLDDCYICLEQLGNNVIKARCGHYFHDQCYERLRDENFRLCPVCRRPLGVL